MKALVTGANGHIGNNLVRALAARGYEVVASVRSLADTRNATIAALKNVELVELDVRDADAFRRQCETIDVLFHLAATYALHPSVTTNLEDLIADSVVGAQAAMRAAARQVRKVVMTSSMVTLPMARPGDPPATEADWQTDMSTPYYHAKTEAEKQAWALADRYGVNLVTILPGTIGGPGFLRRTPSTDIIEGIMLGALRFGAPRSNMPYVDVRDVVAAHILAAERDVAGRFIICNDTFPSLVELTRLMHDIDPRVPATRWTLPELATPLLPLLDWFGNRMFGSPRLLTPELAETMRGKLFSASNARARAELGWSPEIPIAQSLAETMATLRALRESGQG